MKTNRLLHFLGRLFLASNLLISSCLIEGYASQSIFTDPIAGSCSAGTNIGNGTCTISAITAFSPTETITFTSSNSGAGATFGVVGTVSGSMGTVTSGSTLTVFDSYGFPHFTVTLSNGATPYGVADSFHFNSTAGSEMKASNFNLFTLSQVCANGCSPSAAILHSDGTAVVPSLSFSNSVGSGLYKFGTNSIGFATAGVTAGNIDASQNWTLPAGLTWVGVTDASDAAAGKPGQYLEACSGGGASPALVNAPATGVIGDITSLPVTAGDWDISGFGQSNLNGAGTYIENHGGIGTASGSSSTGLIEGKTYTSFSLPTSAYNNFFSIPMYRTSVNSTTTYYLKMEANYGSGTPKFQGCLFARRRR